MQWADIEARIRFTEEQYVPGTSPSDLDELVFREFLECQGFDLNEDPQPERLTDMRHRGLLIEEDGELRVTVYGMLCFSRTPQMFRPLRGAWVEMVAYAGVDRATETSHGITRPRFADYPAGDAGVQRDRAAAVQRFRRALRPAAALAVNRSGVG